ncbi:MAG: hypothetical protein IJ804_01445 [Prevotella sp.]|nr:hypothetical protein [Prevotella sp.]
MTKKYLNWLTIMMMVFVVAGYTACGSDDDDDNGGGTSSAGNALIGTWKDSDGSWWESFTFTSSGTGTFKYYSKSGSTVKQDNVSFEYSFSSNNGNSGTISIRWTSSGRYTYMKAGSTETRSFTISNNALIWGDGWGTYYKQ